MKNSEPDKAGTHDIPGGKPPGDTETPANGPDYSSMPDEDFDKLLGGDAEPTGDTPAGDTQEPAGGDTTGTGDGTQPSGAAGAGTGTTKVEGAEEPDKTPPPPPTPDQQRAADFAAALKTYIGEDIVVDGQVVPVESLADPVRLRRALQIGVKGEQTMGPYSNLALLFSRVPGLKEKVNDFIMGELNADGEPPKPKGKPAAAAEGAELEGEQDVLDQMMNEAIERHPLIQEARTRKRDDAVIGYYAEQDPYFLEKVYPRMQELAAAMGPSIRKAIATDIRSFHEFYQTTRKALEIMGELGDAAAPVGQAGKEPGKVAAGGGQGGTRKPAPAKHPDFRLTPGSGGEGGAKKGTPGYFDIYEMNNQDFDKLMSSL